MSQTKPETSNSCPPKDIFLLLVWGAILGWAIFQNFVQIAYLDLVFYRVIINQDATISNAAVAGGSGLAIVCLAFWRIYPAPSQFAQFHRALLPLLLLIPVFFLPSGVYSAFWFIAITGITAFRYFAITMPENLLPEKNFKIKWLPPVIIAVCWLCFIAGGFYLQKKAFDTMYLGWSDWGYFLEALRNTLHGKFFHVNGYYHGNFLGGRFCLGLAVLLPYVWLFNDAYSFFLMNSFILGSGGIIIYFLCRKLNFAQTESFIFGLLYFLIPGFFNMNMAMLYSFHEVYFTIPAVLLAFYFYHSSKYFWAIIFFLYSLTIQETVPILYIGFAAVFILQRKYKLGTVIFFISIIYFFTIYKVVFPWIGSLAVTSSMHRYAHLGNSMIEVALSPLMRPEAFWSSLLRPGTFYFAAALILPLGLLALSRPLLLLAMLPLFGFLCIEFTNQTQNVMMHYQTMMLLVIIINAIYCYNYLKAGRVSNFYRFLLKGLPPVSAGSIRTGALYASLLCAALCYYFCAQTPFTKNPVLFFQRPDCRPAMAEFSKLIPPGVPLTASYRVASHFLTRNNVFYDYNPYDTSFGLKDYVIFDLRDTLSQGTMLPLRDYLLKNKDYNLLRAQPFHDHYFMLFKKEKKNPLTPPLVTLSNEQWNSIRNKIAIDDANFELKTILETRDDKLIIRLFLKVIKVPDYDVFIKLNVSGNGQNKEFSCLFGNGFYPAYFAKPGEVYPFTAVVPASFADGLNAGCELEKLSFQPAKPEPSNALIPPQL